MDFTIALKKREVEQAEALQAKVKLQDISLYKSEAAGAGPCIGAVEPVQLSAELDSEVEHKDSSGVHFAVTLRVSCDSPLTFHIQATYLARYRFADQTQTSSKKELEAFRKSYAVLAVWPYLREFVQTIAARMGFPTEPLPLLRVVSREG
jgi:preprotein translocase subunit SecB